MTNTPAEPQLSVLRTADANREELADAVLLRLDAVGVSLRGVSA